MPNPEIPLHLCQILEEEFENLHETLDDADAKGNGGVAVKKDWAFHEGHVNVLMLVKRLKAQEAQKVARREDALELKPGKAVPGQELDLTKYLASTHPKLLSESQGPSVPSAGASPADDDPPYAKWLNAVLKDDSVFTRARFEHLELRDETRALMELDREGAGLAFSGGDERTFPSSDRARYRRLLLEDAFPGVIKRVYDIRLDRVLGRIHALPEKRSALCFSGGGIRSGSFALGIIQGLANHGLLDKFDYLSTVSGGGYIGGWLTAWIHRHPDGLKGVIEDLNGEKRDSKLQPEPAPLRHLRDYSSFLTPRTGLLSADSWTFATIYVRNLLLNWSAMIPLLLSVLMVPRVVNAFMLANPLKFKGQEASPSIFMPTVFLFLGTLLSGYVIAFMRLNRPSNGGAIRPGSFWDKHRDQSSFLKLCFLPLLFSGLLLTVYWAWLRRGIRPKFGPLPVFSDDQSYIAFGIFGLAVGLLGGLLYLGAVAYSWRHDEEKRSPLTVSFSRRQDKERKRDARKKLWQIVLTALRELGVTIAAGVIAALLLYVAATKIPAFYDLGGEALAIRFDGTVVEPFTQWYAEWYTCLAVPAYLLVFFVGTTLFVGFTSRRKEIPPDVRREKYGDVGVRREGAAQATPDRIFVEDEDREWLARFSAWLFIGIVGWSLLSTLVLFGPLLLFWLGQWIVAAGGLSGLLTILGGRSARTPADSKEEAKQGWKAVVAKNLIFIASFVFIVFFIMVLSLLTGLIIWWLPTKLPAFNSLGGTFDGLRPLLEITRPRYESLTGGFSEWREMIYRAAHYPTVEFVLALAVALQLLGRFMARKINLNKFSLHAGYRDRLIRAFLGASRLRNERRANPFTGFDPRDNLYMHELRPGLLSESDFRASDKADSKAPSGLIEFVDRLKKVTNLDKPPTSADEYLRQRIKESGGQSDRYFNVNTADAKEPSFKSALFADLNRILQTDDLDKSVSLKSIPLNNTLPARVERVRAELDKNRRGDYRILLNRFMLEEAYPEELVRSVYPPPPYKLLHVVCMALNLVGGDKLAWQQRKAETFTATPLHCGNFNVGYRRSRDYGGRQGIALGTAVAVSGAAASSNMGYFSPSAVVTFVLTLFNARLGWWLGNPGVAGHETYYRSHPVKALSPIIDEAFGLTNDRNPYVLLSDGGHFENLGLYEMVLRRCHNIVVVDGSADPEGALEGLGDAVRKIRIDLGIRIEFESPFPVVPRPKSEKPRLPAGTGGYCAVGTIHYEDVDDKLIPPGGTPPGRLVYIKPTIYGSEPRDIYNYAKGDPTFPHESTADQFFDEPQFESHRMLGSYITEELWDEIGQRYKKEEEEAKAKKKPTVLSNPGEINGFVDWLDNMATEQRQKAKK